MSHCLADDAELISPLTAQARPQEVEPRGIPTTAEAVAQLRAAARWRAVFDELRPEEYAGVGRSTYPGGVNLTLPLRDILWWMNREIIHHTAEIALLRDLYLWRVR